jgi:hypothetical protein
VGTFGDHGSRCFRPQPLAFTNCGSDTGIVQDSVERGSQHLFLLGECRCQHIMRGHGSSHCRIRPCFTGKFLWLVGDR